MEKIVFDSAQLPGDSRVRKEAWIDTLACAVARLTVEPASGVPFDGALEIMPLHGGAVCTVGATIRNILHASADVAIDGLDTVVMMVSTNRQPLNLVQQDKTIDLTYGEAVLFDQTKWTNLSAATTDMSHVIGIRAPRELMRQQLPNLEDHFFRPVRAQSGALGLVRAYTDALLSHPGSHDPSLAKLAMRHLADLMSVAVSGLVTPDEGQSPDQRAARMIAIGRYIDRGFSNPHFSLATLSRRLGVTPRHVQRLLAENDTSFVDEVMRRRLHRARELLTSSQHLHLNVIAVAHECGFSTVSHFHRVFRRHFGMTPGEARERPRS
jgi:AraC-like DNA-binding protein